MVTRIAHISDLHFGAEDQNIVWSSLKKFLNEEIKPDLVLITGDIVDSPDKELFKQACTELKHLAAPYRVCAGNHDRWPYGNAFNDAWEMISMAKKANAWFDNVFIEHMAKCEKIENIAIPFKECTRCWNIGILGIDSSASVKYFAQGFVESKVRLNISKALVDATTPLDAVILLVHHHVLQIPASEPEYQKATDLFNLLGMINSTQLLESLAQSGVDIVVHGHRHVPVIARYGTVKGGNQRCSLLELRQQQACRQKTSAVSRKELRSI